jgi:hypothetical protein
LSESQLKLTNLQSSEHWGNLSAEVRSYIETMLNLSHVLGETTRIENERLNIISQNQKVVTDYLAVANSENATLAQNNASVREQINLIGLTESQIASYNKELAIRKIAEEELNLIMLQNIEGIQPAEIDAMQNKIRLMKESVQLTDELKEKMKMNKESEELASAFTNAFDDLISGTKSFKGAMDDLTSSIMRMITEVMILEPLKASLTASFNSAGGGGGIISSMASSMTSFFGGFFAEGGRPPMNKVSVVGEKGPELFVPDTKGTIIPNHNLGGGEVNTTTVNQSVVINVQAPNGQVSKDSLQQIQTAMGAATQRALRRNS